MGDTPNLNLPFIMAAQAQKHVTHNDAIRAFDVIVQLAVLDRDLTTPPGLPGDGDRYIVASGSAGAWAGRDSQIAAYQDNAWMFYDPQEGWLAWVGDEDQLYVWSGTVWLPVSDSDLQNVPMLGVNAMADGTNRLAVSSPAALFNHEGADHLLKINKNAANDTASVLFQTNSSGRAEFGTTGDDDWHVKVSPDGTNWNEVLIADKDTGRISFPSGGARNQLSADKTYYVNGATGSDANDGETPGTAFATIAKAVAMVIATDLGGFHMTIDIANGTYSESLTLLPLIAGSCTLSGDTATPSNVVLANVGSEDNITCTGQPEQWKIEGVKLTGNRIGLEASGGHLQFADIEFATSFIHMRATHLSAILMWGKTVTITGTPAFSTAFARVQNNAFIRANGGMVYSGAATGKRYDVIELSGINTGGGGASHFPGDVAGTTATGGQYI